MALSSPHCDDMDQLCDQLRLRAGNYRSPADWPAASLKLCADAGLYRGFLPRAVGGWGWSDAEQVQAYVRLASCDLTTTFIITQFLGACKRMVGSTQPDVRDLYLNALIQGDQFATVGISHLTTSSQHLGKPVLRAVPEGNSYVLDGMSPWVTGAAHADMVVMAATLDDGRQLLANVMTNVDGVQCGPGADLVALSASCTDRVVLNQVYVEPAMIIAGPQHEVMKAGSGAGTGGLQTSALAAGLANAAVEYLRQEAVRRRDLEPIVQSLEEQVTELCDALMDAASGRPCDSGKLRGRANRLVMNATQAAMTAAKGAGFVASHPVGRWCREALFFLVWSCPQPVAHTHLCELAGIE